MINGPLLLSDENTLLNAKLMELTLERQRVLSNNIANANTPGYIRRDFEFTDSMSKALAASKSTAEVRSVSGDVVEDRTMTPRLDGNNIVLPREMNEMMQNGLFHKLLMKSFNTRLNILRNAMK